MTAQRKLVIRLAGAVLLAFIASMALTWILHDRMTARDAYKLIDSAFLDVEGAIRESVDRRLIRQAMTFRDRLPELRAQADWNDPQKSAKLLRSVADELLVDELCVVDRNGILTHSGSQHPETPEGECVRRADRIAYLNHDLDDALRSGLIRLSDVPPDCLKILGQTHRERINTMITDIVSVSTGRPHLSMSPVVQGAMDGLREFMFQRVYRNPWRDPEEVRCDYVLRHLFEYYCAHPGEMPEEFVMIGYQDGIERSVCDYLSCMTDRYATRKFTALFAPSSFPAF